ncbi:hypothetical protein B484DRAFT_160494 [Ochromonadaceae sp. CCMP2298]|nr:hypothetical protein B484DRAFT_160494 [Ochromonadaceae sp. CCMP2298]
MIICTFYSHFFSILVFSLLVSNPLPHSHCCRDWRRCSIWIRTRSTPTTCSYSWTCTRPGFSRYSSIWPWS